MLRADQRIADRRDIQESVAIEVAVEGDIHILALVNEDRRRVEFRDRRHGDVDAGFVCNGECARQRQPIRRDADHLDLHASRVRRLPGERDEAADGDLFPLTAVGAGQRVRRRIEIDLGELRIQ